MRTGGTARVVGEGIVRVEDERLLKGRGRFTDDIGGRSAEAAFVRSEHAHARILGIDVEKALDVAGVQAIYTYDDLGPGVGGELPVLRTHPGIAQPRTQHALASEEVCYAGQPIAAVIARDRYIAEDAAARVLVEYEALPAAVGLAASALDGAIRAHCDLADNVAGGFGEEKGDVERALRQAPHVFTLHLGVERSAAMPIEGRAVYARPDGERGLLVYDTTQTPTSLRAGLARMLGLEVDRLDVVAPDIGGAFGMKGMRFYSEEVVVPWAAQRLGQPVRWTEDRREQFIGSNHERGQLHTVTVGCDEDGRITGMDVSFVHDNGAYLPYGLVVPLNTAAHLQGPYRIENFRYAFRSIYTNTVPTSPYRGGGRPQGVFVVERTLDRIAAELGLDRAEVRRRNLIAGDEMPYSLGITGQDGLALSYDSGDYGAGLDQLLKLARYGDFEDERRCAAASGRRLGFGLACFVEGSGIGPYEGASVDVLADGTVTVASGLSTQGQGHHTAFAQIAADELGVPVDQVEVLTGDTRLMRHGIGTFASRAAAVGGSAVKKAAAQVRERAAEVAARELEASPEDVVVTGGQAGVRGSPESAISLGRLAVLAEARPVGGAPGLGATAYHAPQGWTWGFGAHAAVVEVSPETAAITVLRYFVLDDCGRVINPLIVRGQVLGALAQGIGGALYEQIAYDEDGQIQNASLMDFLMPFATEVPRAELEHTHTLSPHNELGIKGVGEAGALPVAAAIAGAVEHATGLRIESTPIFPAALFSALSATQ